MQQMQEYAVCQFLMLFIGADFFFFLLQNSRFFVMKHPPYVTLAHIFSNPAEDFT